MRASWWFMVAILSAGGADAVEAPDVGCAELRELVLEDELQELADVALTTMPLPKHDNVRLVSTDGRATTLCGIQGTRVVHSLYRGRVYRIELEFPCADLDAIARVARKTFGDPYYTMEHRRSPGGGAASAGEAAHDRGVETGNPSGREGRLRKAEYSWKVKSRSGKERRVDVQTGVLGAVTGDEATSDTCRLVIWDDDFLSSVGSRSRHERGIFWYAVAVAAGAVGVWFLVSVFRRYLSG